jgi:Holliday junction resolvasome RuvABC DNA-binding subunit
VTRSRLLHDNVRPELRQRHFAMIDGIEKLTHADSDSALVLLCAGVEQLERLGYSRAQIQSAFGKIIAMPPANDVRADTTGT